MSEKINKIQQAIELIMEAEALVDSAVNGSRIQSNYLAYRKYGFAQLLGNGNPYDGSLEKIMNQIKEEEKYEKEYDLDGFELED